jgi:trehalose 6-phosphate synthase
VGAGTQGGRLVVVANRLPSLGREGEGSEASPAPVGGLVSALRPALEASPASLWVGWSGRAVTASRRLAVRPSRAGGLATIAIDLPEVEVERHYNGYCNGALWPLLHCFPERVIVDDTFYQSYELVNRIFARVVARRLRPGDRVWVHDYHLIPLGRELRRKGFRGRVGFFLHVPFPPHDVLSILPQAAQLLGDLETYDLVSFHTERSVRNYRDAVALELGRAALPPVRAHPIGIDPAPYQAWAHDPAAERRARWLDEAVRGRRIVLGVDRLDYTKGIPERLRAFARLLETYPRFRRRVTMIQISAPSRTRVAEYARQRQQIEELVGNINGRFGEADWVPVRYLFRSYSQKDLVAFYREAAVCLVSPLRDGMNLVAKEYVACQAEDPGVLVLSRFAGAAEELREALIVNPRDIDGTARALAAALAMPRAERIRRHGRLLERVRAGTAAAWARAFLEDLDATAPREPEILVGAGP